MNSLSPSLRYGIYIFSCIGLFFLLMKVFGLENVYYLRCINFLFVIYFSNRLARESVRENTADQYLKSFGSIFLANAIAVILSVFSFAIYVSFLDVEFLSKFEGGLLFAKNISLGQALASVFLEGMADSLIVSYSLMQYWKDVKPKAKIEASKV